MILYYVQYVHHEFGEDTQVFRNKGQAAKFARDIDKDSDMAVILAPTKIDIPANKDSAVIVLNNLFGIIHGN